MQARINSTISPDFEFVSVISETHGAAALSEPGKVTWEVGDLGVNGPETAALVYEIRHVASTLGEKPATVTNLVTAAGGVQTIISNPELVVIEDTGGGGELVPEGDPKPVEFTIKGCQDAVKVDVLDVKLASLGRIVQLDVTLKQLCPGRQTAVSVFLTEVDQAGKEKNRGVKHLLVPALTGTACQDVTLRCIQFSVPETLDPSGNVNSICNDRSFQARVIANYVDSDHVFCENQKATV